MAGLISCYTAVEVGSAGCLTLRVIKDVIVENRQAPWRVVGIDLPEDRAWSLDWKQIGESFDGAPLVYKDGSFPDDRDQIPEKTMSLWLLKDPRMTLLAFPWAIDFAFIDGCHGSTCVQRDFEAIEGRMRKGALMFFHDAGEPETGTDYQEHCCEFINVRSALKRLGLMDNRRPGWQWLGEIRGSRHWGGDGNSIAVIRKV